ncbi:hypothetical protein [Brachybacterium paraconglomeratum]|uniref:hypothetical protein n=1 Tax=Brachybacterium paraconglomeratum TaxID=173362 RepID=UPI003510EB3B
MTTHITPADPGRHLGAADDPAELLAEARLSLHEAPADCLLLSGTAAPGRPSLITRSSLHDLLAPCGGENLRRHVRLVAERGAEGMHALIVIGDGRQSVLEPLVREVLARAGGLVAATAAALGPGGAQLLSLRGAADGRRWELRAATGGDEELLAVPAGPLRDFAATQAAARAVLAGRAIPQEARPEPLLEEIGRALHLPPPDLASAADPGLLLAEAGAALRALRRGRPGAVGADGMTKCEHIAQLLAALAVDRLHWELLAQLVEHGGAPPIARETLLQELVADPTRRPHPDVCAGGRVYVLLEEMRCVASAALDAAGPAARGTARPAWRALTALLVLLAWWNHRFATAGSLVDELRHREPDSTLAPLLSRMTDTPVFPAWWPST